MTMIIDIKEQYLYQFQHFIDSLPKDAIVMKYSLDFEIEKRLQEYREGTIKTQPFEKGLSHIRQKILNRI